MNHQPLPIIDWGQAIQLAGNKRDLAEDILSMLIASLPADINEIAAALKVQNHHEMLRLVHKLHGALCYTGLPRIKSIIARLESDLKNNIMDSLMPLFEQLQIEVNVLLESYSRPLS
jgi:two-component system sensor histidine kinase BarA